ncbi:MAG: tRNA uridine-5-carboxymethylaminomethyl(34) synthesis GTPase MnmE [Elusimicrobiota bacterium]|jgi:tRNA modification GTPase|nr:tRNA uridine-5-carboxymethylaminomethyl(34) synthesis GTPase MnmE [Elusimicrobiota bacterium]
MPIFSSDTIAAFATASASGAVALLRISGPQAFGALKTLTRRETFEPRRATLCKIYDGRETLDIAVATIFPAPKSYSGEDMAEIALHAGPYIKARALELLADLGVRPAKPGEFTMRAFLNGKMDLAQAQGVADIIAGGNKAAHKAAMHSLEGRLTEKFQSIRAGLADLLAQLEVRIDDADGEVPPLDAKSAALALQNAAHEAQTLAATFSAGRLVKDGVKTAIIGLPNSGKSSLLNALLGYERAIVSYAAGTTRDTVDADFEACGARIILTDTAGIRAHSSDPAEKEGMARSRRAARAADIIIFVKDNSADVAAQAALLEETEKEGKKIIAVINKADLLPADFLGGGELLISCKTGRGIEELKNKIAGEAGLAALRDGDMIITSAAHYGALQSAAVELSAAADKIKDYDLAAEHLRRALAQLAGLIGETTPEDVLDIIFSKFCVGK